MRRQRVILKNLISKHGRITSPLRAASRFASRRTLGILAIAGIALFNSGCSTVGYLVQAGKGQWELSNKARPIEQVLLDERVKPRIRRLLADIPKIKKFGEEFGVKPTSNYVDYVALDRPSVVWVVSASERLKLKPREWSFPIVGSFTYVGWFDQQSAIEYAKKVEAQEGVDVDVRGASAYSTLGWFRDPVLSTMITRGEEALGYLVNVVLHESVHATLYVNNQSYFNESVASFIADRLTPVYLERMHGADSDISKAYVQSEAKRLKANRDFQQAYLRLEGIYQSDLPDEEKLSKKAEILQALRDDHKIERKINNATLIQYRTYGVGKAEYEVLFRACGKSWKRFWMALNLISEDSFAKPQQEDLAALLLPMAKKGCPKAEELAGQSLDQAI